MAFELTPSVHVRRDADGRIRQLRHPQEPFAPAGAASLPPRAVARAYLTDLEEVLEYPAEALAALDTSVGEPATLNDEGSRLKFLEEKVVAGTRVIAYQQTHRGVPVWRSGTSVVLEDDTTRVTSGTNEFRYDVDVSGLDEDAKYTPAHETNIKRLLSRLLGKGNSVNSVTSLRLVIYRFDPDARFPFLAGMDDRESEPQGRSVGAGAASNRRTLAISRVARLPDAIEPGRWYVGTEVLFSAPAGPWPDLPFRAVLESNSGAILYLEPGVSGVDGLVFRFDPQSQASDATITPCSSTATLNAWRESVTLQGLTTPAMGADQELDGDYVTLGEQSNPAVAPPTEPVGDDFDYDADTNDFAAVNAYWHVDESFRFIDSLPGISLAGYFGGTTFPVVVDHRDASLGTVNARAYANAGFNGSGGFGFNLAQSGCSVGIAADIRIVWHEVCHGMLLDHVGGFNFGFAHSAGDALGVILSDWAAPSVDRFETFPFNTINRRHDRDPTAGWAWGGTNDTGGYAAESILATTLFRLYRSIGGDSTTESQRRLAAEHTAYLIIGAIGTLTSATNPPDPDGFATALMDFDKGNDYVGISRGALHKVVRWAFEEQGLYQPAGAPTPVTGPGAPPAVDVYIDDGRAGEYEYQRNFWSSTDMWNRLAADGGTAHETPVTGQANYMYVRVRNRGSDTATDVQVQAFHCQPGTGLVWPDDWQAMTPASLAGADIPSGGSTIVGPFEWTPTVVGHECLLAFASADGDLANDTTVTTSIPHGRLVPFDNNIGQRNVAPVPGGGGAGALAGSFAGRAFVFRNPHPWTVEGRVEVELPAFLSDRGWSLRLRNPGGGSFTLPARGEREIVMELVPGQDFEPADVDASERAVIEVLSYVDDILVGGMSYPVDPRMERPPREVPGPGDGRKRCPEAAAEVLRCLGLPSECVTGVRVRRITVDIDFDDCC